MKRLFVAILGVALLTGVAFTAELWNVRTPDQKGSPSALTAFVTNMQMEGFPLPEPASIIVSSLVLLGGTTVWRRRRTNRRA
jgi:hypothetical protein